jgi:hypothetical protein
MLANSFLHCFLFTVHIHCFVVGGLDPQSSPSLSSTPVPVESSVDWSWSFVTRAATWAVEVGAWSAVSRLAHTGRLATHAVHALVAQAIEHGQGAVLRDCLLHVGDIAETDLVAILAYALHQATPISASAVSSTALSRSKGTKGNKVPVSATEDLGDNFSGPITSAFRVPAPAAELVALVVSAPRNDAFLQQALAALPDAETAVLLDWLTHWMSALGAVSGAAAIALTTAIAPRFPSMGKVIHACGLSCVHLL